jgi:hypothetical protein
MRLSEKAHLPFREPFDRLTVPSKVEGLTALSKVDPSTWLRVEASKGFVIRIPRPVKSSLRETAEPI